VHSLGTFVRSSSPFQILPGNSVLAGCKILKQNWITPLEGDSSLARPNTPAIPHCSRAVFHTDIKFT
jgi:hypothetical protein